VCLVLTSLFDRVLDLYGQEVTVKAITRTYDDRGDATETEDESTLKCVVVYAQRADARPYPFANMDNISVVIYARSKIDEGDKVVLDGKTWRVEAVRLIKDVYAMGLSEVV